MMNSLKNLLNKLVPGIFGKKKHIKLGLYGPPNAGKCVTPETKIVLQNGEIKTIKEIFDEIREKEGLFNEEDYEKTFIQLKNTNLFLPSLDQNNLKITPKKVSFVYSQKYKGNIFKITTRTGREIRVTPEHPLIQISNNGITKTRAEDLKVGNSIAICKELELTSTLEIPEISTEIFIQNNKMIQSISKYHNPKMISYPKNIDANLVRFIGYVITESNHKRNRIKFTNSNQNLLNDFEKITYKLFKLYPITRIKEGSLEKEINSKTLTDYLEQNLNLKPALSGDKKLPAKLMGMPKNLTKELLQVLFDCEGSVPKEGSERGKEIEYSSKSQILVEQVQLLLNRFGIVGKYNKRIINNQEYWRLLISGSDQHRLFRDNIGFSIDYKKERLDKLCKAKLKRNKFSLPIMNFLEKIRSQQNLLQKDFYQDNKHIARMIKNNRITYHRLNRISEKNDNEQIKNIAKADTMWDDIKSIETEDYNGYIY